MTTDENLEYPILLMTMVEDVKERGGSSYVVEHDRAVLDWYLEEYGTERMETEMTQDQGEGKRRRILLHRRLTIRCFSE